MNISAEIINARFLRPLDKENILTSIRKTKRLITIEDNVISGGLASALKYLILDEELLSSKFYAYPDEFIKHGSTSEIEKHFGMTAEQIAKDTERTIKIKNISKAV